MNASPGLFPVTELPGSTPSERNNLEQLRVIQTELLQLRCLLFDAEIKSRSLYHSIFCQTVTTQVERNIADVALADCVNLTVTLNQMDKNAYRGTAVLNSIPQTF